MRPYVQLLSVAIATSLSVMIWAAARGSTWLLSATALAFAVTAIAVAMRMNAPLWTTDVSKLESRPLAAAAIRQTSIVTAALYAWGGAAMTLVYRFSGLHWQHGWQYGLAMLLIATGLAGYVHLLGDVRSSLNSDRAIDRVAKLAALQGIAATFALAWLAGSGKLATTKGDWAANIIFVTGGLAIAMVSAIVTRTHHSLTRSQ